MTKITIEVDGQVTQAPQQSAEEPKAAALANMATGAENDDSAALIRRAAATGALNAGPAPSAASVASQAPIATSLGGGSHSAPTSAAISAGAAPGHTGL